MTATENVVAAAVLAEGTTIIRNAACEPHVQDQCRLLVQMGARIDGIGSNVLVVHGGGGWPAPISRWAPTSWRSAASSRSPRRPAARSRSGAPASRTCGCRCWCSAAWASRSASGATTSWCRAARRSAIAPDFGNAIPRIDDGPWPAFPADLMSVALVTATQAAGTVLFHEKMYESRLFFVDRLIGMGARVVLCDPHRALVHGPARLRGEPQGLPSPDIRAGIALVIARAVRARRDGHPQRRADRSRLRGHRRQAPGARRQVKRIPPRRQSHAVRGQDGAGHRRARGIGLAIAERLLGEGARVAMVDRDAEVEVVAKRLGPRPGPWWPT